MRELIVSLLLMFLCRSGSAPVIQNFWIIWNVGQGQWITQVTNNECRHYDFGGEINYFKNIQKQFIQLCSQKYNLLYLSHPDLDHYAYLSLITNRAKSVCWMVRPENFNLSYMARLPPCTSVNKIPRGLKENQTIIVDCNYKDKNSCSTVFKRKSFLIPGDSPKSQEKFWLPLLENKTQISVLILGHHCSRTSTKTTLLSQLPNLKMAVASARRKKYGHPHLQTVETLKQRNIPLLKTESWGNLHFL